MGTQTAIAAQIQQANADYILALKANHPTLYQQVKDWFEQAEAQDFAGMGELDERVETGHHRIEKRSCWSVPMSQLPPLYKQADWLDSKVWSWWCAYATYGTRPPGKSTFISLA